jgi:hypothetical protein
MTPRNKYVRVLQPELNFIHEYAWNVLSPSLLQQENPFTLILSVNKETGAFAT